MRTFPIVIAVAACTHAVTIVPTAAHPKPTDDELVSDAAHTVAKIYADPAFLALVSERVWLAGPGATSGTPGEEVARALGQTHVLENAYKRGDIGWGYVPFHAGGTFASTSSCAKPAAGQCGTIKLNGKRLERGTGEPTLINTIAHENTHTLGDRVGTCGCEGDAATTRFTDAGYTNATKVWLVSYAIGDLAQCWVKANHDPAGTRECMAGLLDGQKCNRRVIECCANADDTAGVLDVRARTSYCSAMTCPPVAPTGCN